MILPLRRLHRRVFAVLGILLPVAFVAGIAARKPVPGMDALPAELAASQGRPDRAVWERSDLFSKSPVRVGLLRETAGPARHAIEMSAPPSFLKPDLLVYWVEGNPALRGTVPDGARLLGGFGPGALGLPTEAATREGVLVLFSLADQEIVDVSKPVRFDDSTR
jgi:hypothetical protein